METLRVELADRSYDILIGEGLLAQTGSRLRALGVSGRVAVVTDQTVAALHLESLRVGLASEGIEMVSLSLPAGEATKSWPHFSATVDWLLEQKVERGDIVVALGGGVIGDLAGFAAAVLRRGVRYVQIPTSLLAQVDSSVGGKTAINSVHGKNLIGAFHQPVLVLADVDVLGTLTERDFLAGYGEVVKYGLLGDEPFFDWLEQNAKAMAEGDVEKRIYAVKRSCEMKAEIVSRDETEQGERALLNLGHTFCHALEAATGYSDRLLHGEGVAVGCALAFEVSARMGLCSQEAPSRVRAHLEAMGMMRDLRDIPGELPNADALIELMGQDKKVVSGTLNFIMARGIGEAFVTSDVDLALVKSVLKDSVT
ncbi:MAG: 3-dehydroquinate synthase [Pseudomonadota bacterium]